MIRGCPPRRRHAREGRCRHTDPRDRSPPATGRSPWRSTSLPRPSSRRTARRGRRRSAPGSPRRRSARDSAPARDRRRGGCDGGGGACHAPPATPPRARPAPRGRGADRPRRHRRPSPRRRQSAPRRRSGGRPPRAARRRRAPPRRSRRRVRSVLSAWNQPSMKGRSMAGVVVPDHDRDRVLRRRHVTPRRSGHNVAGRCDGQSRGCRSRSG